MSKTMMPQATGLSTPTVQDGDFWQQDLMAIGKEPKNLEIGSKDMAAGLAGSGLRGLGTGVSEFSLGDAVRAGRSVADGSAARGLVDTVKGWVGAEGGPVAADGLISLAPGLNPHPVSDAAAEYAGKAADAVEGAADWADNHGVRKVAQAVGGAVKGAGEAIIERGTSDDYKTALQQRQLFEGDSLSDFRLGDGAGDPAVWAAKLVDGIGSLGATLGAAALTGGAVKSMVKRSMLKRGASAELAEATAREAGMIWGQRAAVGTGMSMSVGQSGDQTREQVLGLPADQLMQSETFREHARTVASDPAFQGATATQIIDEAHRRTADTAASVAKSNPATWAAAAAGTMMGDANLFKMLQGAGAKGVAAGIVQGALGEGVGEAVEEGSQQYIGNTTTNQIAGQEVVDPMSGVLPAAATAGTIGIASGGGIGAIGGLRGGHAPQEGGESAAQTGEQDKQMEINAEAWDRGIPSKFRQSGQADPEVGDIPDLSAAREQMAGETTPGAFTLAVDQGGYRGVYVDSNGKLAETPLYADREGALVAMRQNPTFWTDEQHQEAAQQNAAEIEALRAQRQNNVAWATGRPGKKPDPAGGPAEVPGEQQQQEDSRDTPAFLRQGDTAGRFKGFAEDSEVQRALAGEFGPSVAELVKRQVEQGEQGPTPSEKPIVDAMNAPIGLPHKDVIFAGDANAKQLGTDLSEPGAFDDQPAGTGPQFRGGERTRWQPGQDGEWIPAVGGARAAAGQALPGRTIEGDGREVGSELPFRDVVYGYDNRDAATGQEKASRDKANAEQAARAAAVQGGVPQIGQSDTIFASGEPGADSRNSAYTPPRLARDQVDDTLGEQSVRDPRTEAGRAIQKAGSESDAIFSQLKSLRITKRGQPFGSLKEAQLASRKTETPIELPTGGFGVVDKAELEQAQANQQPAASHQEDANGVPKPVPEETTLPDPARQDGMPPADDLAPGENTAPAPDAGVAASGLSEAELIDRDLLKEHAGRWKYRYAVAGGWATANRKEDAVSRANEAYLKAVTKGEAVPTRDERAAQADEALYQEMDGRYGRRDLADLNLEQQRLGGMSADLHRAGSREFNGNGGRRTAGAVSNEGARATADEARKLAIYMEMRKEREQAATTGQSAQQMPAGSRFTIEPLTDKSIIVKGDKADAELRAVVEGAWPKAKPLYNAKQKGWVFSNKREGVVREALARLEQAADTATNSEHNSQVETNQDGDLVSRITDSLVNALPHLSVSTDEQIDASAQHLFNTMGRTNVLAGHPEFANRRQDPEAYRKFMEASKLVTQQAVAAAAKARRDASKRNQEPATPTDSIKESELIEQVKPAATGKLRDAGRTMVSMGRDKENAPRQTNTPKRASQAASAIRDAQKMQADGETLLKIADAVDAGEAPHLAKLSNKAQYQTLDQIHRRAIPAKHMEGGEYRGYYEGRTEQRRKTGVTVDDYADQIQYPKINAHPDHLRSAANALGDIRGYKGLSGKLSYAARLVTNADRFRPAELDEDTAKALVKAAKDTGNRDVKWASENVESGLATIERLRRMGIDNRDQLVAAIKELDAIQVPRKQESRLQQLERGLVGNKIPGYFNTQGEALNRVMAAADVKPGDEVLEPSAGKGNIADAAKQAGAKVDTVERHNSLREILAEKGHNLIGNDFTQLDAGKLYDKVIMNPPFEQQQDIDHVRKAWQHVKPGGRLVAVMSAGVEGNSNRKASDFRQWLDDNGGSMERLPEGSFKASDRSTGVNTVMVVMDKPGSAKSGDAQARPSATAGATTTVHTPSGKPVSVRYQLVEASDLVASHDFDGNQNDAFPQELQPRDRSRATSRQQLFTIAQDPNPERLTASAETDRGAPIVKGGIVESGNGRVIGLTEAYRRGNANTYKQHLADHAAEYGLTREQVENMAQPVLVRERLTDMTPDERRAFTVDSNKGAGLSLGASEQAMADAAGMDDAMLARLNIAEGGDVLSPSNEDFLNAFANMLGNNELGTYKSQSGEWTAAYRQRVMNAIFAKGYGNTELVAAVAESANPDVKNVLTALMNTAGRLANLRGLNAEDGATLAQVYADAANLVARSRRDSQSIKEILAQGDMLGGGVTPYAATIAELMSGDIRSARKISSMLSEIASRLADNARNREQTDIFTGETEQRLTAEDVINEHAKTRQQASEAAPRPGQDLFGANPSRNNFGRDSSTGATGRGRESESGRDGERRDPVTQGERMTVGDVTVNLPTIDPEQEKLYNHATHRGPGRDFSSEIKSSTGRILNDLQADGLLDTKDQQALAAKLVQGWIDREADNANKAMAFGIKNPSWVITGRSGRSGSKDAALERENQRLRDHQVSQDASLKRMKDALAEHKSAEAKSVEQFKAAWREVRQSLTSITRMQQQGLTAMLSDERKASPRVAKLIEQMMDLDPQRARHELSEQNKRLVDAGLPGLLEAFGPRSAAGKAIASVLDGEVRYSTTTDAPLELHSTTKELELFVKGWQKRYKGGAGVRILVGDTQADLNEVLQMVGAEPAPKGQQVEAAYLPGYKTLLLNAAAIKNAKHARQILQHEVLAHHGLREVVGDDAYISIIEAVKRGKNIAAIKQAYYDVAQNYSDMHPDVQAEEVFAHWAENQPERGELSLWWRGIVRRVKDALRAVGLLGERTTEEELGRVFDAIVTGMKNGRKPGRRVMEAWNEVPVYSLGDKADPFKPDTKEAENYRTQLAKAMASLRSGEMVMDIGRTPAVLRAVGAPDLTLRISRDTIRKATNGVKHDVPMEVLEQLPELLHDPVAVFDSKTNPGDSLVALLDAKDASGRGVISAIQLKVSGGKYLEINRIASVHGRPDAQLNQWLSDGLAKYIKENHPGSLLTGLQLPLGSSMGGSEAQLGTTQGLQLPKRGSPKRVSDLNILTADDIRNSQALFRLGGETADDHLGSAERKLNLVPPPDVIDRTKSRIEALRGADKEQVKSWWQQLIHKANTNMLDGLAPIKYAEEAQGKLDASESGYAAARLATGSSSTMQATLLYGLPEWNDGVIQKKAGTGEADSLLGIFEGLGKDLHSWLGWMAGHRAERLMAEGRENLLTSEEIQALKQQGAGKEAKFDEAKAKWNRLNGATLDLAQEAGLMTKEQRDSLNDEWYIPFFRESEDGDVLAPFKAKGIANQSAGIKKLKGGKANVNDLLENIFTTTGKLIDASMKNMAAQKVVWNLAETDLIEVVPKPNLMDMRASAKPGNQMIWVKMDGEDYLIKVHDADLFRAMTMIDQKRERGPVMQLAMKAKHLLTAGVTSSPEFMLRNFMRDAVSAWAINEDGFTPLIDSIKGVKQTLKMNGGSIDMMFSGASFLGGYVSGNNPEAMASSVRKALRAKGMNPDQIDRYEKSLIRNSKQAWDVLGNVWRKYERVGEAIENGSREAVYSAAIKAGKSHAQAAFEAKDLMDFSMLGSSKVMQFLVDVLPFFNARMQGLGKLGRAMRDNPAQIARRGGMIAAASLALLALNWDDDRYDDLPDWDKDLNWHFFLGDQHFRIPKPFEIGLIFGTLPERMTRAMGGKDTMGKFGQVVARNMLETFAINPIPQVVKPISEAYFNYDPFRGGPIDNLSDLNVLPEARYDDRTSLLMRELGELTGWSPKKLQHIVEGYTGTMGAYVLAAGDALTRAFGNYGSKPSFRADEIPLLRTVYQGSAPARSSQAMTDFYKLLEQVNSLQATINRYRKEGRYEDATELLQENRQALAGRQQLNAAQKQFRALRNEMQLIMRDRTLTAEGKRERIDRLLARRNNLASQMIHRFEMQ